MARYYEHCMADCIRPWTLMCVARISETDELCGWRACNDHRCIHDDDPAYPEIPHILRAFS